MYEKQIRFMVELCGWLGAAGIVLMFALITARLIERDSLGYQLTNLLSSTAVAAVSIHKRAFQPAALNAVWALIALVGLASSMLC